MTRTVLSHIACGALFLLLLPAQGGALADQKKDKDRDANTRRLSGIVQMPNETPVAGAIVKIKNRNNLQVRSFITLQDGKYLFQNLSTGVDYEVQAEFKDLESAKRTLSVYDSRPHVVMNLTLEPAKKE